MILPKKKEKIFNKIVKKNFNNELEHVLEHKSFDENTKNILLSVLYKLEAAYGDYELVKNNVMPKDEFLQRIIDVIQNDIETIELIKMSSPESKILGNKTFIIDKENKKITCYPIERKLLYCISKISKQEKIVNDKYFVLNKTISDLLTVGNNINTVEPIRDFNGFSWSIVSKDIESIEHNLIYQNLRIIVGAEFLNKWIYNKEFIIDYYDIFKNKLEDLYGKKIQEKVIDSISKLSVLLEVKYNRDELKKLLKSKKEIEEKLDEIQDNEDFIKRLTKEKKDVNKQLKKIDTIISDKKLLQEEYQKRNETLPLEKKIFSMRVLAKTMKEERQQLITKRANINKMLNPQKFIKYKKSLEEKYQYLQYLEESNVENKIPAQMLAFQDIFLDCYKLKIKKAKTQEEIVNLLIELRYYLNIPFNRNKRINQLPQFNEKIQDVIKQLINKSIKSKVLVNLSTNQEVNYLVLKEIFNSKIINLQIINIDFTKENGKLFLKMFDENVFDEQIDLGDLNTFNMKDFLVKFNKNIKLFVI